MRYNNKINKLYFIICFSLCLCASVANSFAEGIAVDTVRILIIEDVQKIQLKPMLDLVIVDADNKLVNIEPGDPIIVRVSGSGFNINNKKVNSSRLNISRATTSGENNIPLIQVGDKQFRGNLLIINQGTTIEVINILNIEEYLCGVVPREMPYTWQLEALKAQAVAARTYTLNCLEKRKDQYRTYDLKCTIADQVYGGYNDEKPSCNTAISTTCSEILVYENKPIKALYHGNSGGALEDNIEVFGTNIPYLKGKPDKYAVIPPNYIWSRKLTADELQARLNNSGMSIGRIDNVEISKLAESGRVREITFSTPNGKSTLSGVSFRNRMGTTFIRSTLFTMEKQGDTYIFSGKGSGHGVGMSQCTAQNMVELGIKYRDILAYFYPGADLVKINSLK
jgi:stage II sporulation protein D